MLWDYINIFRLLSIGKDAKQMWYQILCFLFYTAVVGYGATGVIVTAVWAVW